ncbi:hypothetical protein M406DRAFT_109108 [Cryphonectria parasitica EP155]|uniref:Uncharacterized protein n=1 Tax=Cryphonectria parasitica (strain ATCC 38755 / EP155) TaxID=660469 RepID=A0A9P5CM38_CRYP1|nr:uncharacterized protein M406DRAFT_109108 [Cryphonectria parasitica EP155]KAF3763969.1 hypothetical protein M406DRAFT_109108 [Cryphonectria parasitica EP155]
MRYTHLFQSPPSPSDAGLIKAKAGPLAVKKPRLPNSRHHHIRKTSISTGASSISSVEQAPAAAEKKNVINKAMPLMKEETIAETDAEADDSGIDVKEATAVEKKPALPRLKAWESYLHWLCLTEEPGTLWTSALCAAFQECLAVDTSYPVKASECASRIDDIYWSFYLPLDPLLSHMEDRILSGYLLHVWTMFIELGKRIPYNDEGQDRLVELLKELVHLPPMEVRTWEGNDAPWSDLPTLDDALVGAWDDLYDPENQSSNPEGSWVNYFAFLGRLVAAEVTPDWWEIPATTLKEVLSEESSPTPLTRFKTMAVAEFMNQAGDSFFEWCIDSGALDVNKNMNVIVPLTKNPVKLDWFDRRRSNAKETKALGL